MIAIIGPDGCGKSSVCTRLAKQLNARLVYMGKRNFYYRFTEWTLLIITRVPAKLFPLRLPLMYMFYVLEFIDRNIMLKEYGHNLVLERHFIDRLIRAKELIYLRRYGLVSNVVYFFEYPLALMSSMLISQLIKKRTEKIFLLDVKASTLFERSTGGEYLTAQQAECKRKAYLSNVSNKVVVLDADQKSIEQICDEIESYL